MKEPICTVNHCITGDRARSSYLSVPVVRGHVTEHDEWHEGQPGQGDRQECGLAEEGGAWPAERLRHGLAHHVGEVEEHEAHHRHKVHRGVPRKENVKLFFLFGGTNDYD